MRAALWTLFDWPLDFFQKNAKWKFEFSYKTQNVFFSKIYWKSQVVPTLKWKRNYTIPTKAFGHFYKKKYV